MGGCVLHLRNLFLATPKHAQSTAQDIGGPVYAPLHVEEETQHNISP